MRESLLRARSPTFDLSEQRRVLVVAVAAAGIAVAAQLPGALHNAFQQDEVASARSILERTPWGMLSRVARTESTPPGWFALGWVVHRLGASPYDVRMLSVLCGALVAGATVLYARTLVPLWAAGFAGLLTALGYEFVLHGAELRAYQLYLLFSVAFPMLLVRFVSVPTRVRGGFLALDVALGSLTHYYFLLIVLAGLLWVWLGISPEFQVTRRRVSAVLVAGLAPLALSSVQVAGQYRHQDFAWIGPFNPHRVVTLYWSLFARAQPRTPVLHDLVPVLFALLVLAGCLLLARQSPQGRLCALLAVVPVVVAAAGWLIGPRIFDVRNLLAVGPFAAIAIAATMTRLWRPFAIVAVAAGIALAITGYVRAQRVPPPAYDRVAADLVAEGWTPGDPIVLYGNFFAFRGPLEWYLPHRPQLTLVEPRQPSCPRLFAVALGAVGHERVMHAPSRSTVLYAGKIAVARIDAPGSLAWRRWRNANLLAAVTGHPACARLLPEQVLAQRARP